MNLRVRLTAPARAPVLPVVSDGADAARAAPADVRAGERVRAAGCAGRVPVHRRSSLPVGAVLAGPAVILDDVATTWLAAGWRAERDRFGNLLLRRGNGGR